MTSKRYLRGNISESSMVNGKPQAMAKYGSENNLPIRALLFRQGPFSHAVQV
jgi:hypothetical protein